MAQISGNVCDGLNSFVFVYKKTTEPNVTPYFDVKTGHKKFRIFIAYGLKDDDKQHMFSKDYPCLSEAINYGRILRDCLELEDESLLQNRNWDYCRFLEPLQFSILTDRLHLMKINIIMKEKQIEKELLVVSSKSISDTPQEVKHSLLFECIQEEHDRNLMWWSLNESTYLYNKTVAEDIVKSIRENAQFELYSQKLYQNYIRRKQADFFLNMIDYVDPVTSQSYFSFKTDLMEGVFSVEEILSCKRQFMLTLCEPGVNGVYMCNGMRHIVQQLNL
jgi:hypothetical protein